MKRAAVFGFLASALAVFLLACPPPPPAVTPIPPGILEAGEPTDAFEPSEEMALYPECARACSTLKKLGCPEAERPDGGKSCYMVCADANRNPGMSPLRPSCVASATTVAAVRACGTIRCLGR